MKYRVLLVVCLSFAVLSAFTFSYTGQAQTYVNQYHIQVNSDGSGMWVITQVTSINSTIDTWDGFQERVRLLIGEAVIRTGREMDVDSNSFEMGTVNHQDSQSKETEFRFVWLNFSIVKNGEIRFGDVFQEADFFSQLYGEGSLQIIYPSSFTIQSVSPAPNLRDDVTHSMEWLGTQFFVNSNPSITLTTNQETASPTPDSASNNNGSRLAELIGLIVAMAFTVALAGFYLTRRRKKQKGTMEQAKKPELPLIESEAQKIVKILQSSAGSIYQSALTDQTKFSKAKVSLLLSELEKKGVVTRYKKGRDKIVTLVEKGKGER